MVLWRRFLQGFILAFQELNRDRPTPALELWLPEMLAATLLPEFLRSQEAKRFAWCQNMVYFKVE